MKKYPRYWFRNVDGKPATFSDCACVKETKPGYFFAVHRDGFQIYSDCSKGNSWIEVPPEETVLILGYLP